MDNRLVLEIAQRELEPDEVIQWTGHPDPIPFSLTTIPIVLFGIIWTSFSVNFYVTWLATRMRTPGPPGGDIGFMVMPFSFVLIGIGMLSSPFFLYNKALGTVYAITNQRLLIINSGRSRTVQSFRSVNMNDLELTEKPNGSGNLLFAWQPRQGNDSTSTVRVGFVGIQNVREAHRLLVDTFGSK